MEKPPRRFLYSNLNRNVLSILSPDSSFYPTLPETLTFYCIACLSYLTQVVEGALAELYVVPASMCKG